MKMIRVDDYYGRPILFSIENIMAVTVTDASPYIADAMQVLIEYSYKRNFTFYAVKTGISNLYDVIVENV